MLFLKPDVTKKNRELFFLEGFVWSHQSITGLISRRQFVPKCQFLASRPLGGSSFQNILTNPIISQINTLLLPYLISYYSSASTINQFHNYDAEVYAPQRLVVQCFLLLKLNVNSLLSTANRHQINMYMQMFSCLYVASVLSNRHKLSHGFSA